MWNCMRNFGADSPLHDSGCCLSVLHQLRGALLRCQSNAVLPGALVLYLVHCFVVMKPVTPLRACVSAGLKPVTPLRPGLRVWVKPPSPLLGENVGFSGVEGSHWRWRFHWSAR